MRVAGWGILASRRGRLLGRLGFELLRPLLIRAAAVADLLVKRHDMSALVALAEDLVVLEAPEQRRDRAEDRDHEPDGEPQQERAALVAADEARGQPATEADEHIAHPVVARPLEDADGPEDRDDREDRDDDRCEPRHDPDHDLEKDPGGNDENKDGQRTPAEISCCFAHALRVRPSYKTKGGLVGT